MNINCDQFSPQSPPAPKSAAKAHRFCFSSQYPLSAEQLASESPRVQHLPHMRFGFAAALLLALSTPTAVKAVTLDQACQKFASKLTEAQASGDKQKVQNVYSQGSQRGQRLHPPLPIGEHHLELGLLEHHFRHPNWVGKQRIHGPRPAAIRFEQPGLLKLFAAAVNFPPAQKTSDQRRRMNGGHHSGGHSPTRKTLRRVA